MGEVITHEFKAPSGEVFKCRSVIRPVPPIFVGAAPEEGGEITVVEQEGKPWFVGLDVCRSIGIENPQIAYLRLDASEKFKVCRAYVGERRGGKDMVLVSESGLYKLILRSDKPNAKPFQDWVTKDVLPAIRKTGGYLLNEEARAEAHADTRQDIPLPADTAAAFRLAAEQLLARADEADERARLVKEVERLTPQARVAERHFAQMDHMKLSRFVRTLEGVNSNRTKSDLERLGYLYIQGGTYLVRTDYRDKLFVEKRDEQFGDDMSHSFTQLPGAPSGHH